MTNHDVADNANRIGSKHVRANHDWFRFIFFFNFLSANFQFLFFLLQLLLQLNSFALRFCGILNKRGMIKLNFNLYIYFISPYKTGNNMMQGLQQFSNKMLNIYV